MLENVKRSMTVKTNRPSIRSGFENLLTHMRACDSHNTPHLDVDQPTAGLPVQNSTRTLERSMQFLPWNEQIAERRAHMNRNINSVFLTLSWARVDEAHYWYPSQNEWTSRLHFQSSCTTFKSSLTPMRTRARYGYAFMPIVSKFMINISF